MNSIGSWLTKTVSQLALVICSVIDFAFIFQWSFDNRFGRAVISGCQFLDTDGYLKIKRKSTVKKKKIPFD